MSVTWTCTPVVPVGNGDTKINVMAVTTAKAKQSVFFMELSSSGRAVFVGAPEGGFDVYKC
jgi:hypothetical protein